MTDNYNNDNSNEKLNQEGEAMQNTTEQVSDSQYSFWAEQAAMRSNTGADNQNNESENQSNYQSYYNQGTYQQNTYQQNLYQQNPYQQNLYQQNPYQQNLYQQDMNGQVQYQQPYKERKTSKFFGRVARIVATAAVFGLVAGGTFIGANELFAELYPDSAINGIISDTAANGSAILTGNTNDDTEVVSTTVVDAGYVEGTDVSTVAEKVMPATVAITSTFASQSWYGTYEEEGGGTGIIVKKGDSELLLVTNNHVIEDASKIMVTFIDGTSVEAEVKGTNANSDLAVLSIDISDLTTETLNAISVAALGDSDEVKVGEMVVAIGNALGYGQSVTVGYVSAKDREVTVDAITMTLLQTDAAINPGNSGGALINMEGEVIGINSVKYASSEVEGMGFAIPISNVTDIIEELMNRETLSDEEKGYLGVYINDVTQDVADTYNWPVGVYVVDFTETGAAEDAGIMIGDIITGINGETLTTASQLIEKVTSYRYGTTISVTIQRLVDDEFVEMNIDVALTPKATTEESVDGATDENTVTPTPEIKQPGGN